jgi:8-oxo-dGTP pyrophosphatase MutT (NUDIX family)
VRRDRATTRQAADELGIGISTLQAWAAKGIVTPVWRTPGGHARWDIDDLRRQLDMPQRTGELVPDASSAPIRQPVVAVIATSAEGVLVTKRHDGKPPYGFLTGEIEPGESPADAAVREAKEEAGLTIRAGETIAERIHPKTGRMMFYMAATPVHGIKVFVGDEDELAWVGWLSLAEADERMAAFGGIYEPVHEYLARVLGQPG